MGLVARQLKSGWVSKLLVSSGGAPVVFFSSVIFFVVPGFSSLALAAQNGSAGGAQVPLLFTLPFVGLLLSIAVFPLVAGSLWHRHYGKIAALWAFVFFVPYVFYVGAEPAFTSLSHTMIAEYFPFIVLLFALFTISGGILIRGNFRGTPGVNTVFLSIGTGLASVVGTTGASMVLIRPLIRANDDRRRNTHVIVFFIFLVSNIGGSLTPLGDPPLFLGFLKGIDFFWPATHLILPMLVAVAMLLVVFYLSDRFLFGEPRSAETPQASDQLGRTLHISGWRNVALLGVAVGAVLVSGIWDPGVEFLFFGQHLKLQDLLRDVMLIGAALVSIVITEPEIRAANGFSWFPILEVAKLFSGIFVTIIPAIAILQAGSDGALSGLVSLVVNEGGDPVPLMYFWLTGILSSFLDNAPTYLVFFNLAGGDPSVLMGPLASTLLAISVGAVFMGANTYIGNAPNFMVRAIAEERGIRMPSFFGYFGWSILILFPVYMVISFLFFM